MRYSAITAILCAGLLGQDQPPAPVPPKPPEPKFKVQPAPGTGKPVAPLAKPAAKTCAIPLLNVLKEDKAPEDRMPKVIPQTEKFSSKDIIVPAPSCDDVK